MGSSPPNFSFASSICLDSLLAVRSTGLKNRRVVVRLHLQAPQCEKPLLEKLLKKRPVNGDPHHPAQLFCCFIFMPPHIYKRGCGCRERTLSIYFDIYRNKNYFCGREFLHLGSAEFVFYSTILYIFMERYPSGSRGPPAKGLGR